MAIIAATAPTCREVPIHATEINAFHTQVILETPLVGVLLRALLSTRNIWGMNMKALMIATTLMATNGAHKTSVAVTTAAEPPSKTCGTDPFEVTRVAIKSAPTPKMNIATEAQDVPVEAKKAAQPQLVQAIKNQVREETPLGSEVENTFTS